MFTRLKEPFGKAGLIVALVALVFAMIGGAYAATGNGGKPTATASGKKKSKPKQGPRGKTGKTGKTGATGPVGPAGATGPAGPAGAPGARGDAGAKGDAGEKGLKGEKGEKGEKGTTGFTKTLPKGETETGTWSVSQAVRSVLEAATTPISFPIPLAQAGGTESAFRFTKEETENEEFGSSGCTGTVEEPTAPEGILCVYTGFEETAGTVTPLRDLRSAGGIFKAFGASGAILSAGYLEGSEGETARLETSGSWAVTAP